MENTTRNQEIKKVKSLIESIKSNPSEHLANYKLTRLNYYLKSLEKMQ